MGDFAAIYQLMVDIFMAIAVFQILVPRWNSGTSGQYQFCVSYYVSAQLADSP